MHELHGRMSNEHQHLKELWTHGPTTTYRDNPQGCHALSVTLGDEVQAKGGAVATVFAISKLRLSQPSRFGRHRLAGRPRAAYCLLLQELPRRRARP